LNFKHKSGKFLETGNQSLKAFRASVHFNNPEFNDEIMSRLNPPAAAKPKATKISGTKWPLTPKIRIPVMLTPRIKSKSITVQNI
jgi:hypothetical protein